MGPFVGTLTRDNRRRHVDHLKDRGIGDTRVRPGCLGGDARGKSADARTGGDAETSEMRPAATPLAPTSCATSIEGRQRRGRARRIEAELSNRLNTCPSIIVKRLNLQFRFIEQLGYHP
jgi:hypothetical protein